MISNVKKRASVALLGAGVVAGSLGMAGVASASTPACSGAGGKLTGSCGTEVNAYGNGWDVKGAKFATNTPIIAWPAEDVDNSQPVTNDPALDFYAHNTTSNNTNERVFEATGYGVRSGYCISDPDGGYAADPGGRDGLVLRKCNGTPYQEFVGLGDTQNDQGNKHHGIQWQSDATNQVVSTNGTGEPLDTTDGTTITGSYFHWVQ